MPKWLVTVHESRTYAVEAFDQNTAEDLAFDIRGAADVEHPERYLVDEETLGVDVERATGSDEAEYTFYKVDEED